MCCVSSLAMRREGNGKITAAHRERASTFLLAIYDPASKLPPTHCDNKSYSSVGHTLKNKRMSNVRDFLTRRHLIKVHIILCVGQNHIV